MAGKRAIKSLKQFIQEMPLSKLKRTLALKSPEVAEEIHQHTSMMVDEEDPWWTKRIQYRMAKAYVEYVDSLTPTKPVLKSVQKKKPKKKSRNKK